VLPAVPQAVGIIVAAHVRVYVVVPETVTVAVPHDVHPVCIIMVDDDDTLVPARTALAGFSGGLHGLVLSVDTAEHT